MVVALHRFIKRQVLFNDFRALRRRRERDVNAAFMAGIADRTMADLFQARQIVQIYVFERRGVGRIAMQQHVFRADCVQQTDGFADFGFARHAGRAE